MSGQPMSCLFFGRASGIEHLNTLPEGIKLPNCFFAEKSNLRWWFFGLASFCAVSTTASAQDDLAAGIAKLQRTLDVIVGDGNFDLADEEFCRGVLWTSQASEKQEIEERLGGLSDKDFGVMNLTGQIQSYQKTRSEFLFLYKRALDRDGSVQHPPAANPDADQFASACSLIVGQQMEEPQFAEVAESARSQASFGVISDLLYQVLRERRD